MYDSDKIQQDINFADSIEDIKSILQSLLSEIKGLEYRIKDLEYPDGEY